MKDFFKFFTASCLGVFAAIALIFLIGFGFMASMAAKKPTVAASSILEVDLSSPVPEKTGNVEVSPFNLEAPTSLGLHHIVDLIEHAATDDKIKGILIKNTSTSSGPTTMATLREALMDFKDSKKMVYAYGDYYSQGAYYVASVADSVYMNPQGSADVKGYAILNPFFKSALDKLGVKMRVFYAGNFKSATEPFRRDEMSEENKLQTMEFLTNLVGQYKEVVAKSRGLTVDQIDDIMTNYKGKNAKSSLECGLIDKIAYWDQVESSIKSKLDIADDKKVKYISLADYNDAVVLKKESSAKDKVAVVIAEGTVNYGTDSKGEINESKYVDILQKVKNDKKVKAVVLRVNSGGGSSLTSDIIWREVENIKASGKPVIASFGDYAASGGYYIACGADTIVSGPSTLTGSIGVFSMFPDVTDLTENKLGFKFDGVKTHPMALPLTPFRKLTAEEEVMMQASTIEIYDTFLDRVATGRGMTVEAVHEVAQGRVWTGEKALELGLVDVLGDLDDAIEIAAKAADLTEYKTVEYPTIKETFIDQVIKGFNASEMSTSINKDLQSLDVVNEWRYIHDIIENRQPQARIPFELSW